MNTYVPYAWSAKTNHTWRIGFMWHHWQAWHTTCWLENGPKLHKVWALGPLRVLRVYR
jgi:hypothetical protein